ncbi:MAG: AzlC family ABC transporter permease [Clostridia bacterium]|nr:AzlC family ABC transporter permease [Clostridia bacterium]
MNTLTFKMGLKNGLPIALGYLSVSFAFGVKASLLGIPVWFSALISMTNLTSAGQLAGITVIAALGTISEMLLTQLVINSRYFLMGISLSQKYDESFTTGKRLFLSAFITDEIFAVAISERGNINARYFLGLALLPYIGWAAGTIFGAIAGNILPQSVQSALGIALYAMFIAIIVPPATKKISVLFVVMLAAAISCAFFYIPFLRETISAGFGVVICAVIAALVAAWLFPIKEKETENA